MNEYETKLNKIHLCCINPEQTKPQDQSIIDHQSGLHITLRFDKPISWFPTKIHTLSDIKLDEYIIHVAITTENECIPYDEVV